MALLIWMVARGPQKPRLVSNGYTREADDLMSTDDALMPHWEWRRR
ncbi:MAG: hypothetical protein L7S70_11805 [Pseudomonadales bacterium]|nr:hypothetical protein [Pseudomonadales bacterium]